jgi:hypothetical protein
LWTQVWKRDLLFRGVDRGASCGPSWI